MDQTGGSWSTKDSQRSCDFDSIVEGMELQCEPVAIMLKREGMASSGFLVIKIILLTSI